jgi:predicted transcriptional regulator
MSSKVYLNSVSSLIEAGLSNSEITGSLHMSDVVVNPHVKKLVNKTIIIECGGEGTSVSPNCGAGT